MRGLRSRVRRLEHGSIEDLRNLSDAELDRRLAEILAPVIGQPVEAVRAAIPSWRFDGAMAALVVGQ